MNGERLLELSELAARHHACCALLGCGRRAIYRFRWATEVIPICTGHLRFARDVMGQATGCPVAWADGESLPEDLWFAFHGELPS